MRICFKALLLVLALLVFGFRQGGKSQTIYRGADRYDYVRLVEAGKDQGRFEHPAAISAGALEQVMLELQYVKPGLLGFGNKKGNTANLFPKDDAAALAPYLSQALAQATASQWVDFSWRTTLRRNENSLFVNRLVHNGVLFVREGKLQIAFRNLGFEEILESDLPSRQNPTRSAADHDLALSANAEWPAPILDAKGKPLRRNWIAFPLTGLAQAPEPSATPPAVAPAGESATPAQASPAPGRTYEERLRELKSLLNQGLITPQDYERKKQEILQEL